MRIAVAGFLLLAACSREPAFQERVFTGETQGTTYTVRVVAPQITSDDAQKADDAILTTLDLIDRLMSTYRPDSQISLFNKSLSTDPFPVAPELVEVLEAARRVSDMSGGAFDVTVAPLVRAWGFGPDGLPEPPPPDELARLRDLVGYRGLEIDRAQNTLRKTRPEITVDLNGIAQGYTVDKLALALDALQFENYMIEIGGEVKAHGHNARGVPWQIGVERPVAGVREIQLVLPISNTSVSTSGDYRKYRETGGVRISHTIDPHTGKPIEHKLASVTVVNPSCTLADGFCTAIMVLGPEEGYQFAVKENLAALMLIHKGPEDFTERQTPQFEEIAKTAAP
ncbi:MAG: FAD:protein FMN transferase [Candidatus Hydrogenedentes bacterium]|nr:FAD:protein FMN transferase [Candidatus Hydrogenedentota bacterium]